MLTHAISLGNLITPLTHSVERTATPEIKGRKRPLSKVVFLCLPKTLKAGLIRFNTSLVGCVWQLSSWSAPLSDCCNQIQSAAQELQLKAGGLFLNKGHNPMLNHTQNQLTLSVSETKQKSLFAQVSIIRSAINIHGITQTQENFNTLKADALELVRMLDEIEQNNQRKTSLFNVLAKGTRRVIAERVGFNQAIQYPNAIVKFAGMELAS